MWFSSLASLQDKYEGTLPKLAYERLHRANLTTKEAFPIAESRCQFDAMAAQNVSDGRDLTVVSCWFTGSAASDYMWQTYVPDSHGVVIHSTVARLNAAFMIGDGFVGASQLGRVEYVDFETLDLPEHVASDSGHRSFLKHQTFQDEREIRLATMNIVTPGCLNPDGSPCSAKQASGIGASQPGRTGLFVRCDLRVLIERVVVCPLARPHFHDLIRRLVTRYKLPVEVV